MNKKGYVYIVANKKHGTIYVGVTSDLEKRILEHKNRKYDGFTAKYGLDKLVRYNELPTIKDAIEFEKKIKAGSRTRKVQYIESINNNWYDLSIT